MSVNRTKEIEAPMHKHADEIIAKYIGDNNLSDAKFFAQFGFKPTDSSQQRNILDPNISNHNFTLGEYVEIADKLNISLNDLFGIPNPIGEISSPECPRDTCRMLVDLFDSDYYGFDFGIDINGNVCLTFPTAPPKAKVVDDPLENLENLEFPYPSYQAGRALIYKFIVEWEKDVGALRAGNISKEEYNERLESRLNEIPRDHVKQLSHEQAIQRAFAAWSKDHPEEAKYYMELDVPAENP